MESTTGPVGVPLPSPPATALHADRRPDAVNQYRGVLGELQEREREVLRIVATIQRAAKDLEHWPAVHITRTGAGFPKEVTMAGRTIDGSTWPTGRQLADTLAAWHDAAESLRAAWARLPGETRASLSPPP